MNHHVYVVGPCGAGKTTYGRILNVTPIDDIAKERYPELFAKKPWRWWSMRQGTRKLALEWEEKQALVLQEELKSHCLIICHVGAFLNTELPPGITFVLEPHVEQSQIQRAGNDDLQAITATSQCHWRQTQRQLCLDKAIKLGAVINVPSFVREIDVVRHIEFSVLKCWEHEDLTQMEGFPL